MHIEQRLEFIDSLPALPVIARTAASPVFRSSNANAVLDENKDSGTAGPDVINVYMAGVSEQNRKDVDNCKLLMQLVADATYDPVTEMIPWFDCYVKGLGKLGWALQTRQTKDQTIKASGLTMDMVSVYVLQGLLGANALHLAGLMGKAVDAIKKDDGLIDIYNHKSHTGRDAKFEIAPVWQTSEGSPMTVFTCNKVDVSESSRGILWWKSTTQSTKIEARAQASYLNTELYAQLRAKVLTKLAGSADDFLDNIPGFD